MNLVDSIKKFVAVLAVLVGVTFTITLAFDRLIAPQPTLSVELKQAVRTVIVVVSSSVIILFIRRSKALLAKRIGIHPAAIFQFFMVLWVVVIMVLAVLDIFQVSATTLLVGGGIVSIVIGLVISTFVGNILAGTLVFMTNPFRVGDTVLVNNVPGRVEEISALVTRIRNDIGGQLVIPNTAIVQGGVIVTKIHMHETTPLSRLPYSIGDRVYTTYMSGEGEVKELTAFHTKILLDSGRELTFLNSSVLVGSVAVARISPVQNDALSFSFRVDWDAERTMEAIKKSASSQQEIFKTAPTVLYSSLDGRMVELLVRCRVDPAKISEARDIILKAAYSSKPNARTQRSDEGKTSHK
jgi:small-conductance mechanosensitive channel